MAETTKLVATLLLVVVLLLLVRHLLEDRQSEPVDRARLAVVDAALSEARTGLADLPSPSGLDDQGTSLETDCRRRGSLLITPKATRTWLAPGPADLGAARDELLEALAVDGWSARADDPALVLVHRLQRIDGKVPLVAEVSTDDAHELRVDVLVAGPDGCTS